MFCYVDHNYNMGVGMSQNTPSYPYGGDSIILDQNDLNNWSVEFYDGKLKCSFTRPKQTTIQGVDYDLTNEYYILLAKGSLQAGSVVI